MVLDPEKFPLSRRLVVNSHLVSTNGWGLSWVPVDESVDESKALKKTVIRF